MKNKIIYLYTLISLISIIVVFNFMNNNSYSVTDEYVYGLTAPRGRILDVNGNILVDNKQIKVIIANTYGLIEQEIIESVKELAKIINIDGNVSEYNLKYYYYINNPNSITTKVDFESLKRKVNEAAKNYSYLFTFFQHFEMNKEKEINKRVTKEVVCCIKPIYSLTAKCSKKQRIELIKYAKETLSKYNIKNRLLKNNYILDFGYLIVYRYIYALKPIVKKILFK